MKKRQCQSRGGSVANCRAPSCQGLHSGGKANCNCTVTMFFWQFGRFYAYKNQLFARCGVVGTRHDRRDSGILSNTGCIFINQSKKQELKCVFIITFFLYMKDLPWQTVIPANIYVRKWIRRICIALFTDKSHKVLYKGIIHHIIKIKWPLEPCL